MPDFNKGDNTQQGMNGDGWVWGGLDLNRKRLISVAVTSNEEDEGLDSVYLKVHDDLNNLDYIVTGENLPVGESTIGGGGGGTDLRKCTVTIFNDTELPANPAGLGLNYCSIKDNMIMMETPATLADTIPVSESKTYDALYQFTYEDPEADPLVKYVMAIGLIGSGLVITTDNHINCVDEVEDDEIFGIIPIDPTQDSSVTISFTSPGLG